MGSGTRNQPLVVWPLEFGLGTFSARYIAWPLDLGLWTRNAQSTMMKSSAALDLHSFELPRVPIQMQRVDLLHFTLGCSATVYVTFLFVTLPCTFLTYSLKNRKMSNKCVCGAVGELPTSSLGSSLHQVFAAISSNSLTACRDRLKLAVSNPADLQSLSAATPSPQPTAKDGSSQAYA